MSSMNTPPRPLHDIQPEPEPGGVPLDVWGTTGLKQHGGVVSEEFLYRLRGRNGVRTYREMSDNTSIIGAIMLLIEALVRQAEWRIESADETSEAANAQAEFVEGCLSDMSHTLEDFISEVLSFFVFGWSYFEIIYKLRKGDTQDKSTRSKFNDGKFGWRKIEIRAQETLDRWIFDEEGGIHGLVQQDTHGGTSKGPVQIPIWKAILFRTKRHKNNPEGRSLLRTAVRDWFFLKRIQEIEAIGIERDLAGMPVIEVPARILSRDASPNDKALRAQLETIVTEVRTDARYGALIPASEDKNGKTGFKFELMSTGGRRAIDTDKPITRYETRIAMTFLAEFVMIGMQKVGTQSLFQGKSNLFGIAFEAFMDVICSTFNRFAISRLMDLNSVSEELHPKLVHGDIAAPDLKQLGEYLTAISATGNLSASKRLENRLLEIARLPVPDTTDEPLEEFSQDPTVPTPATPEDMATGLMSRVQSEVVLQVNRSIAKKEIDRDAAIALLEATLGMSKEAVARFVMDREALVEDVPDFTPGGGNQPPTPPGQEPPPQPDEEEDEEEDDG